MLPFEEGLPFEDELPFESSIQSVDEKAGKGAIGMLDAGAAMLSQGLTQIPAGFVAALSTPLIGPEKAAGFYEHMADEWSYKPRTDSGKQQLQKWGEGLDKGIGKLGDIASAPMLKGSQLAHKAGLTSEEEYLRQQNLFQTGGRAGVELGLNFAPVPAIKGAGSAAKGILRRGEVKPSAAIDAAPAAVNPMGEQLDMFPDNAGPGMHMSPQQIAELQARETGQVDMFAPANEPLPKNVPPSFVRSDLVEKLDTQLADQNRNIVSQQLDQSLGKSSDAMVEAMSNDGNAKAIQERAIQQQAQARRENFLEGAAKGEDPLYVNQAGDAMGPREAVAFAREQDNMPPVEQAAPEPFVDPNQMSLLDGLDEKKAADDFYANEQAEKMRAIDEAFIQREQQRVEEDALAKQAAEEDRLLNNVEQPLRQGLRVPKSQLGAIDYKAIAGAKSTDPLTMAGRAALTQQRQRAVASKTLGLEPYQNNFDAPEKVIAAAYDSPKLDISSGQLKRGKTVTPGVNVVALSTNNPVIKFLRKRFTDAHFEADGLSRTHLTDKATGIIPLFEKATTQERVDAHAVIMKGDKEQHRYTAPEMRAMGLNDKTISLVEKYYETNKVKLDEWNKELTKSGGEPVREREGHAPGNFYGDYKKPIWGVKPDGSKEVLVVLTGNSERSIRNQEAALLEKYKLDTKKYTHLDTNSKIDRRALGGNGNRTDLFSGMSDVLNVLARNNPEMATIQEMLRSAIRENADAMYGANKHALEKKGVLGSEGNKPWRTAKENADDFFKGYFRYWEEGILAHKYVPLADEMGALLQNPALDNWPNAKEYVTDYINNATGQGVGTIGNAFNAILDAPFKAIGQGSSRPRGIINQINKRSGQLTMAFGNLAFSFAQFTQILQTAIPEMVNVAHGAGVSAASPALGISKTLLQLRQMRKAAKGQKNSLSPFMQEAMSEAHRRGIDKFSEFQDVNSALQHPASKAFDYVVDATRRKPEEITRSFTFYAIANMLEGKLPKNEIWDVAYNATQGGLFDYNLFERPMMYQKMGTVGQLAGSLQTFKHNFVSQQARWIKEASKGNVAPMAASLASVYALSGASGIPFYQELDELVKELTDELGGVQKNIAQIVTENMPEWAKKGWIQAAGRGAATHYSGLNFQSRLSAANTLPDSITEAVSPYSNLWGEMLSAANQVRKTPTDGQAWANLGVSMAPSSAKGILEEKFKSTTVKEDGVEKLAPKDKRDLPGNPRTEYDWTMRKLGIHTLDQAKLQENQNVFMQKDKRDKEAQQAIIDRMKFQYSRLTRAELQDLAQRYVARGGTPENFAAQVEEVAIDKKLPKQRRLEGTPTDSISSVNKYRNLNGNY
jgi:hypothetical protein